MTSLQKEIFRVLLLGGSIAKVQHRYRVRDAQHNPVYVINYKTFYKVYYSDCLRISNGLLVIDKRKVRSQHGNSFVKKLYKELNQKPKS